jgi:hypothetical protein
MTTKQAIDIAARHMQGLAGHEFDLLTVAKPVSPDAALNLAKVISKLSPLLGNLIEFNTCEYLSDKPEFERIGKWCRQNPGFPDAVFDGDIDPVPGFEIKAWFPLARSRRALKTVRTTFLTTVRTSRCSRGCRGFPIAAKIRTRNVGTYGTLGATL